MRACSREEEKPSPRREGINRERAASSARDGREVEPSSERELYTHARVVKISRASLREG